jgi:hypothetical protein
MIWGCEYGRIDERIVEVSAAGELEELPLGNWGKLTRLIPQ